MAVTPEKVSNVIFIGKKLPITLPTGRKVEIRENNGEDEGVLSRIKDQADGSNLDNYLAGIITRDFSQSENHAVTPEEVLAWPINDRHYTLFRARILSLGNEFKFRFLCPACNTYTDYEQDLNEYAEPNPDVEGAMLLYPQGDKPTLEFTLARGTTIKFDILTGALDKAALDNSEDSLDINYKVKMRNLHLKHNGEWEKVTQFRMFSSKDLAEIRKLIVENDKTWDPESHITCSNARCKKEHHLPLLSNPDFFFPTGI